MSKARVTQVPLELGAGPVSSHSKTGLRLGRMLFLQRVGMLLPDVGRDLGQ